MAKFADDVAAGRKPLTIRDKRKHPSRHARPGENVQLYTGMRTISCRKLVNPDPICEWVKPIELVLVKTSSVVTYLGGEALFDDQLDWLIVADGFIKHDDFYEYHLGNHDRVEKVTIKWGFWNAD